MSDDTAEATSTAVQRLNNFDFTLKSIYLRGKQHTDAELLELADCLLTCPNIVAHLYFGANRLTDKTGAKLARYVATSATIQLLYLHHNQLDEATYLDMASALRTNTSLRVLRLHGNQAEQSNRIDTAFAHALQINPGRPAGSFWRLYDEKSDDFKRLKQRADELGHVSMQMLLINTLLGASVTNAGEE